MIRGTSFCGCKRLLFTFLSVFVFLISFSQNPIVTENTLPGNPISEWGVPDFRDNRIAGFATRISLNSGETVRFKINVQSGASYNLRIYRIGYYGGNGARLMQNLGTLSGTVQPAGNADPSTGLLDCSNWSESASWAIPSNAVSGLYIARLERTGGGSNHIIFIVRNDSRNSDIYYQFPDATWQAYNGYGGNSMYDGNTSWPAGHAVKVSYNRPFFPYNSLFNTDGRQADWYMNATYPMIRWLERNGYDVTYTSSNDIARNGSRILNHKIYMSTGHDEYYSKQMRENVEAARNAGVNLAFFSGNEVYWKTRWENFNGSEDRTLVCYKEGTLGDGSLGERTCGSKCDPSAEWTGLWRTGGNYDGGQPEVGLTGQMSWVEFPAEIGVPSNYKKLRFWRNTSIPNLSAGQTAFLGVNTLGYEWDYEQAQYASYNPPGRITMSSRTVNTLTHKLSLYRHASGALVFGAGTVQWSWGLDGQHYGGTTTVSPEMQQATVNLFADMGVQPGSLQSGLTAASQSTDFNGPTAAITSPSNGATFSSGATITFSGTSTDVGGGVVAAVEISTNGGATWQQASFANADASISWSYTWTATSNGTFNIRVRGVDDSGNIGNAASISITVGQGGDTTPPTVSSVSPTNGSSGVSTSTNVTALFSESINGATVTNSTFQLRDAGNNLVAASVSTASNQITLTPTSALAASTTYTVTITGGVSGVKDLVGNALVNNYTWSFTTAASGGGGGPCPCNVFLPTSTPATATANDGQGIVLGMRFRSSQNGVITGIRYYKGAGTTGTRVGSLWTNTGTLLAQVSFTSETASGWQQALFSTPVNITAGVTYVASYFSPSGSYAATKPYFTQNIVNGPLTGLQDGLDGPNGLYRYSSTNVFPNGSFQSSNYWVDVVFNSSDVTAPTVSSVTPASGATGVSITTNVTATFSESINASTVTTSTFQLRNAANNLVAATVSTSGNQIILTPASPLSGSTVYTATITGGSSGVKDLAGNPLANNYSWSFTTVVVDNTPPTVTSVSPLNGATGVSTGVSVIANFSEAINSATVTGSTFQLRDAGNNLVNATISTSSNQITLSPSAPLNGSTLYSVTITGGTSGVKDLAGNALASNYVWSFTTTSVDNTPPTVSSVSPSGGATGVSTSTTVITNFSEAINGSTVTGTTFQLRDAGNNLVAASLNTSGNQVTLTPSSALAAGTTYTLSITGGSSGVKDLAGNALAANYTSSFTTAAGGGGGTTYTVFTAASGTPAFPLANDETGIVLGMRFRSTQNGFITGIRYYKGSGATGTHIGTLWSNTGTLLAQVTFTSETASGWQQALFSSPVSITAGVTYVASYFSPSGDYAATKPYFTQNIVNGPLIGLQDGLDGPNGLYRYTTSNAFPNSSFQSSNYWVDVVFSTGSTGVAPTVTTHPSSQTVCAGETVSFVSAATGTPTPTVQWQQSTNGGSTWTNIAGAVSSTLTFTATTADNGKQYRAVWTNATSSVNSNAATLTVNAIPSAPSVTVVNNCGSSTLTAGSFSGSLLWSTGATGSSITVTSAGTYTVTQTVNGCTSQAGSGTAAPNNSNVAAPTVTVVNNCGSSTLTASGFTGSLLWSTGATSSSITVTTAGTYTVTQTVNGCTSPAGSGTAAPNNANVPAPTVTVVNNCGSSTLTASGFTGSLLWSTGATSSSITVTTAGIYTVTQTVNGCTSPAGSGTAAPNNPNVAAPTVTVVNNCGSSTLTASGFTGSLLWSTGATSASITVTTAGVYTVTQTVNGCTSPEASGTASPVNSNVPAPSVNVVNNCGSSTLTASGFTGSLLWSTGATSASITVTTAGVYTVTQTVNGCTSPSGNGTANPVDVAAPGVTVVNNCGSSTLTATGFTGPLLWSTGETTPSITVTNAATYTVTQTINGCTSEPGSGTSAPFDANVPAPTVTVVNNCGSSTLTASGFTGSLLWSTGETTASITVNTAGVYMVTQSVNGCISPSGNGTAIPLNANVPAPVVTVENNCSSATLTAGGYTGTLLWSNGATTPSITVTSGGNYSVTQTVDGCASPAGTGTAAPKPLPNLTSNTTASVLTAVPFIYTPTSSVPNTTFSWTRAAVSGIANVDGSGTGGIIETLINSTTAPINVTYVYTLTADGCTSTQNLVVTVNPVVTTNCTINNTSMTANFNSTAIPAGRYIWFNSSFNPGSLGAGTTTVTINVTNTVVTFTANSVQYSLNVPDARIRFDASVTSASTQFANNIWETVVPRSFSSYIFMNGLAYQVPVNFPGSISNVRWTANISIDRTNTSLTWRWSAAVYTTFAANAGVNVKPISGSTQNPYPNSDVAGTPENFKTSLVSGARGAGGSNYTGNFVTSGSLTCSVLGTRPAGPSTTTPMLITDKLPEASLEKIAGGKLDADVLPNPSSTYFTLIVKGKPDSPVTVRIVDMFGQVVERHERLASNTVLRIGHRWTSGAYFAELIQGDQRKIVRIIKAR